VKTLTSEALAALEELPWPGNVRELENLIQRLVVTVRRDEIQVSDLPPRVMAQSITAQQAILVPAEGTDFDLEIRQTEIALLTTALNRTGGSKAPAARLLNIDSQRMKYLCRKYEL
jgi:two-component system response regulator PilR (NtrC family)